MWGSVAGTSKNIGAAIAVGLIAGLISALFYEKLYPSLNNNKITDSFGIVNIWIVAFLGTFVVSPLVLRTYYNNDVDLPTLYPSNAPSTSFFINNKDVAGWSLIYVGISLAVALVAGLIVGLLMKFFERTTTRYYEDNEFFKSASYGLREPIQAPHQDRPIGSAQ
jgi:H+/Cl- antiporter ClcA